MLSIRFLSSSFRFASHRFPFSFIVITLNVTLKCQSISFSRKCLPSVTYVPSVYRSVRVTIRTSCIFLFNDSLRNSYLAFISNNIHIDFPLLCLMVTIQVIACHYCALWVFDVKLRILPSKTKLNFNITLLMCIIYFIYPISVSRYILYAIVSLIQSKEKSDYHKLLSNPYNYTNNILLWCTFWIINIWSCLWYVNNLVFSALFYVTGFWIG